MRAGRAAVAGWKAVAEIRALQSRAAEMEAVRAGAERDSAATRHSDAEGALDRAQDGWAGALEGAFDPGLAQGWFAEVSRTEAVESEAAEALREADRLLEAKSRGWHAAEARSEDAEGRRRTASAGAARKREEGRLAEIDERSARQENNR